MPERDNPEGARPPRSPRRGGGPLGPDSEIGARLRELFAQTELEPIPTDLIDLLERLDDAERKDGQG